MMSDDMLLSSTWRSFTADAGAIAAADVALLAGGLLACLDAPLLVIEAPRDRVFPVLVWNDRLAPCRRSTASLYTSALFAPPLHALHAAAAALMQSPICAALPHCIVTDGTGVALIEGDPGHDVDWLVDAARGETGLLLHPFAPDALWTLLQTEAPTC